MSEESEIKRKDQEEHPDCSYQDAFSQTCKSVNGGMECNTLKSIYRMCPGKKPVEIFRKTDTGIQNPQEVEVPNPFGMRNNPAQDEEEFMRQLEQGLSVMDKLFNMYPRYFNRGFDGSYENQENTPYFGNEENQGETPYFENEDTQRHNKRFADKKCRKQPSKTERQFRQYDDISKNI
ncbi:hypothetical protein WA158_007415 [Blastocystis sp. Blastoise]